MIQQNFFKSFRTLAFLSLCLTNASVFASSYTVNVDTSALFGTPGTLAFDLIDGGSPANSVTISSFATDGTLGSSNILGGASGSLASSVSLTDTDPLLNEHATAITLGNYLNFVIEATNNAPDAPDSSPDGFSFYILDGAGQPITTTPDPTGTNALLALDIEGLNTQPSPYSGSSPSVPVSVTAVPIPSAAVLFFSGLLVVLRRLKLNPA